MAGRDELREKAAAVLRAAAREAREAERALGVCASDLGQLALASAESLETLADTVTALLPQMPEAHKAALEVAARASWERLQTAGLARDGVVGEPIDLQRHRVVKSLGGVASGREVVAGVLAAGLTFRGRRIREAVVSAIRQEE
jgi:molecular chaperone GrpE (heat shock protein)